MIVDPISFAVIKSGLDSIADDMAYTVVRIARSEIVKDVMPFLYSMIVSLLVITFFPDVVLWLPRLVLGSV